MINVCQPTIPAVLIMAAGFLLLPLKVVAEKVVVINGPFQISKRGLMTVMAEKQRLMRKVGVDLVYDSVRYSDRLPIRCTRLDLPSRKQCLSILRRRAGNNNTWYVLPPVVDGGLRYIIGMAQLGKPSYFTSAQDVNAAGDNRIFASTVAAAHELGHVLCAPHVSSETIMNPDAGYLASKYQRVLEWDWTSKSRIEDGCS